MNKVVIKKKKQFPTRKLLRRIGVGMMLTGIVGMVYVFFPLLSWQFYFSAFASEGVVSPVPSADSSPFDSLFSSTVSQLSGVDYTDATNWFPREIHETTHPRVSTYSLSIPKIDISDAVVSTADTNLANHLVQYNSTSVPPEKGTALIFGHSTLPQLFDTKNYKTILAKAYTLQKGDSIIAKVDTVSYLYRIYRIRIVKATDMSVFAKRDDDSYLTLVTCTPPGTTLMRLVLEARLQSL